MCVEPNEYLRGESQQLGCGRSSPRECILKSKPEIGFLVKDLPRQLLAYRRNLCPGLDTSIHHNAGADQTTAVLLRIHKAGADQTTADLLRIQDPCLIGQLEARAQVPTSGEVSAATAFGGQLTTEFHQTTHLACCQHGFAT